MELDEKDLIEETNVEEVNVEETGTEETDESLVGVGIDGYDMLNLHPLFRRNNKNVRIKVCCASCKHEEVEDSLCRAARTRTNRRCNFSGGICELYGVCNNWEMKEDYLIWGHFGDGNVKSPKYLEWFRQKYLEWKKLEDEAPKSEKKVIRDRYQAFCETAHQTYEDFGHSVYVL